LEPALNGTLTLAEKQSARIIIFGHSRGGSEAITLAPDLGNDLIPVLLTIQVDSISKGHQDEKVIPSNVAQAANFYQPNGLMHGQPRIRAADPARTKIIGDFQSDCTVSTYDC
jgi:hypothetical protein